MSGTRLYDPRLSQRRDLLDNHWQRFSETACLPDTSPVAEEIASSWQRSAQRVGHQVAEAPSETEEHIRQTWQSSPLALAARKEQANMVQLTNEGELVAAISDPHGCLLWSYASRHMRDRAEAVNFQAGGRWNESAIGTNAIGLAKTLRRPVTVFSSEHYQPFLHDWVCYAAPIMHPHTGECLGILDLSTTWKRHTALGQAAVTQLASNIAQALPPEPPKAELEIRALGLNRVRFRGQPLALSHRKLEILCLLALNPQGFNLEALHAALYGDACVSMNTLKAELCQLRQQLDGQIGSRPYRLLMPFWADFVALWQALDQQNRAAALALYQGHFLPRSESPELQEWRHCIDATLTQVLNNCQLPDLLHKVHLDATGNDLIRERLLELTT